MQNKILSLRNPKGARVEMREEIEVTLNHHFEDIMMDPRPNRQRDIEHITKLIPSLVSQQWNDLLMRPISLVKVEEAVFQMEVGKAPRPDGFTVNLFHHLWDFIKLEV